MLANVSLLFRHFKGILSCFGFATIVVLCAALLKIAKELDILLIRLVAGGFTLAALFPVIIYKRHSILENKLLMCACGVIHTFSGYMDSLCYRYLPLAIAMTLTASQQAITAILGRIMLKEKLDGYKITGVLLSMVGIILTYKLHEMFMNRTNDIFSSREGVIGFAAGVAGTIGRSSFLILLRKVKAGDPIATAFNMNVSATILLIALYCSLGTYRFLHCNYEKFILLALAISGPFIMALRTISTHLEDVAVVTVATTSSQIVLALYLQLLIFHNYPDMFAITGAVLLMLSILVISLGRWLQSHRS